MFIDIDIDI